MTDVASDLETELTRLRSQVRELTLENRGLRYERDELLRQKEGTQAWLGELMRTSPIAPPPRQVDHFQNLAPIEVQLLADRIARQYPGQKIQAIKHLRMISDLGLKEAKDAIDATGLC